MSVHGGAGEPGEAAASKICSKDDLLARRAAARAAGQRVVQCHGCFDLVHPGHVRHLRFAKSQGDILLVTVSSDEVVRKGTGRPLIPEELRAENLAAIDCVDWVCIEPRPTAAELLEEVQPDIYIKGREYEQNKDPRFQAERDAVERHGGRVVFSSGDVVFSSTALIEALTSEGEPGVDPSHRRLMQLTARDELRADRLGRLVSDFRGKRVLVVGEVIRDTYVFCERPEIAGESPMMTLRPVEHRVYDGGAAIVARHAAALGARPTLVTALPDDGSAEQIRSGLIAEGIEVQAVSLPNVLPEKQRFLVGGSKVMKLDLIEPLGIDATQRDHLVSTATHLAQAEPYDAAIITDFGLGLLSPAAIRRLSLQLRDHVNILAGDVSGRRSNLLEMHGLDLVTPGEDELRDAMRDYGDGLPAVAWRMMQETNAASAIVTLGADGLIAFDPLEHDEAPAEQKSREWTSRLRGEHVPAFAHHAVDALGCGDSLLTVAALALASGGDLLQSAYLGGAAAAIQARRLGNIPVDSAALRREVIRVESSHLVLAGPGVIETRRDITSGLAPTTAHAAS